MDDAMTDSRKRRPASRPLCLIDDAANEVEILYCFVWRKPRIPLVHISAETHAICQRLTHLKGRRLDRRRPDVQHKNVHGRPEIYKTTLYAGACIRMSSRRMPATTTGFFMA